MRSSITQGIILVRRVTIAGPSGSIETDLVLDTGAMITILARPLVEAVGYDVDTTNSTQRIVTGNGVVNLPLVTIEKISVQDIRAENLRVCVHTIPEMAHFGGLLGLDFLKPFRTIIDMPGGTLEII